MQKLSRFKSKKFFIWGAIILLLVGYLSYKHRLEIAVFLSCHNAYAPTWSLDYVSVHNEDMQLVVSFNYRRFDNDPNRLKKIKNTYDSIKKYFLDDPNSHYYDYTFVLQFMDFYDGITIGNVTKNSEKITIKTFMSRPNIKASVKELSEYFPNAVRLHLSPAYYNDITEIDNFTNLEYIRFGRDFTQEEYNYIKKKFPNCEIVE